VVVVDNHSADGTVAIVREAVQRLGLTVTLLEQPGNIGFARANNLGVAALDACEWIALLNPDAFPEPGWLASLEAAARRHPEAASFASRLMRDGTPGVLDGAGDVYHVSGLVWRHGHGRRVEEVPDAAVERPAFAACAAAALYRRDDWLSAGGLDERYFCYVEDVDLGFRLQLRGRGCWYVPDAVVAHIGSGTTGTGSPFSIYHGHRNLAWTFAKDMPSPLVWRFIPVHALVTLVALAWFTLKGRGTAIFKAKWDALLGLGLALEARQQVQTARRVDASQLLAQLDRSSLVRRWLSLIRTSR